MSIPAAVAAPAGRLLLRRTLWAVRGSLATALVAGLAWQGATVAVPYLVGRAVDDGVLAGDLTALLGWAAALLALGLLSWAGDWYRHWWVDRSGMRAAVWLRARLARRVVELDDDTAGALGAGQLVARATADCDTVDNWVRGLATLVTATFTLVAVTAALFSLGPVLAVVGLATIPLTALLAGLRVGAHRRAADATAQAGGGVTASVEELVTGIRTVHGLGAQAVVGRRIAAASVALRDAVLRRERVEASWVASALFVPGAGIAVGVWLGGEQVIAGALTAGSLVAFVGWMTLLVDAVETLTERLITRGQARAAADRLVTVLDAAPAASDPPDPRPLPRGGGVALRAVCAARGGRAVLHGVTFDAAPGEWVAVVGRSGAGKSSLLRLLPRLAAASRGSVLAAGVDVGHVVAADLRRRVAYAGQGAVLLSGTVAENLRLAAPEADDESLRAALVAADAAELVHDLGGLDARIGAGAGTLSGGQRQRLALARALAARPDVLVLDDVTSALDPVTEQVVLHRVRQLLPDATVLAATHRLAVVRAADRVVVLDEGRVVQVGPPEAVLAVGGAGAVVLDLDTDLDPDPAGAR